MKTVLFSLLSICFLNSIGSQTLFNDVLLLNRYTKNNIINIDAFETIEQKSLKSELNSDSTTNTRKTIIQKELDTIDNLKRDSILSVLKKYGFVTEADFQSGDPNSIIITRIQQNPFFKVTILAGLFRSSSTSFNSVFNQALAKAGDLDVTNFAIGLTDFLIERTKTELNTAFFKRFQEELNKPQYKDLNLLFPETVKLLNAIGVEIYQFDHYLNSLRNAFDQDLSRLLVHLPAVVEHHKNDPVFQANPALRPSLLLSLELAGWVKDGIHPGEMLLRLSQSENMDTLAVTDTLTARDVASSIRLATLISESLRNNDGTLHYWVSAEQLKQLQDPITFNIYLGLLYEVSKTTPYNTILFRNGANRISLTTALHTLGTNNVTDSLTVYRNFILKFGNAVQSTMRAVDDFQSTFKAMEKDVSLSKNFTREYILEGAEVFDNFMTLTKLGFDIEKLPYLNIRIPERAKIVIRNTEQSGAIALLIAQKQYAGAVAKLTALLEETLYNPEMETIGVLQIALANNTNASIKANIQNKIDLYEQMQELQKQCHELKALPCFRGKRKQISGLRNQISILEKRAKLIQVSSTLNTNGALLAKLNDLKDTLNAQANATLGKEKTLIQKQVDAIDKQIKGLEKGNTNFDRISATSKQTIKKFLKYGTFMANIVEADSPEAAKKAIEAIALPPGSYTIKRESRFSAALNGYLGAFAGTEYIDGLQNKPLNNLGITMPVGISFSWGNLGPKRKNPWSIGLFVPLIDLGAVASYRIKNDTTSTGLQEAETVPTIQLKHLISPGLFLEAGIPRTPLSFGLGIQLGPRLRTVNSQNNDVSNTYVRFGATLKVDIPLLHFYASPGKR